jgi:membrane-bound lytic murein transglycosylase B
MGKWMRLLPSVAGVAGWLASVLALSGCIGGAADAAPDRTPLQAVADAKAAPRDFGAWLADFRAEAAQKGISVATLDLTLTGVQPLPQILERDRNQAEFKLTYAEYVGRIVTPENIARGRDMLRRHGKLLAEVSARYGVQPRFIVGIWGLETRFGATKGSTPIIPALVTLAYDARRPTFFRNELLAALTMVERRYIEADRLTGSWAGAMGQPQFIPSTYLAYAQDFDGDGRRDIWNSEADVFASVANYLSRHGWIDKESWGRPVRVSPELKARLSGMGRSGRSGCSAIDRMTAEKPIAEWRALGVRRGDGGELPPRDLGASLVEADGGGGQMFLVYRNYQSILRYNCAHSYALTVGTLADRIDAQ